MENDVFVYVDLQGTPHLVGRLWMRTRRDRDSATFEDDEAWMVRRTGCGFGDSHSAVRRGQ